jgi:hypothetical protein
MWKIEPVAASTTAPQQQQSAPVENQQAMQQAIDKLPF